MDNAINSLNSQIIREIHEPVVEIERNSVDASSTWANRLYNFIFQPNHVSHNPLVRVAAIITGLALTLLSGPIFLSLFLWRQRVDNWNEIIEAIPFPKEQPIKVSDHSFIEQVTKSDSLRGEVDQLNAFESRMVHPRLLRVLNVLHTNGIIPSEKALLLKSAAHYLHTPCGVICFNKLCEEILEEIDNLESRCFLSQIAHKDSGHQEKFLELVYLNHCGFNFRDYFLDDETSSYQEVYFDRVIKEHSLQFLATHFEADEEVYDAIQRRDDKGFRNALFDHYQNERDKLDPGERVRDLFIDELQSIVTNYEGDIFLEFAKILQVRDLYTVLIEKLNQVAESDDANDMEKMIMMHQYTRRHLQGLADFDLNMPRYRALQIGLATRIFRNIDDKLGHHHILCGCHIKKDANIDQNRQPEFFDQPRVARAIHPQINSCPDPQDIENNKANYPFLGKAFGIIPARIGAGHITPAKSVEKRVADQGGHVYFTDGPEDLLLDLDPLYPHRWLSDYVGWWPTTTAQFLDDGIKYERYWLLEKAQQYFNREETQADIDIMTELLTRGFLQRGLDFVVPLYQRHARHMAMAAEDLGAPTLLVGTDLWDNIPGWKPPKPEDRNQLDHFRFGMMLKDHFPKNKLMESRYFQIEDGVDDNGAKKFKKLFKDSQLVETGFPVHESFFKKNDEVETRKKYAIPENARVILVMSAGAGIKNDYPETIRDNFRDVDGPLHVVVLCGSNADELNRHINNLTPESPNPKSLITQLNEGGVTIKPEDDGGLGFTILPRIESSEVAALMRLTKEPKGHNKTSGCVLSLKSGGGTMSEVCTIGTRAVIKTATPWEWETENALAWIGLGMGATFKSDEEMWDTVKLVIDTACPLEPDGVSADVDDKEASPEEIDESIAPPKPKKAQKRLKRKEVAPRNPITLIRPPHTIPLRDLVSTSRQRMLDTMSEMMVEADNDDKFKKLRAGIWKPLFASGCVEKFP